jgi:hypothetical protein
MGVMEDMGLAPRCGAALTGRIIELLREMSIERAAALGK